ncbi:MAG: cation transporter [Alphaproteobacteria bacterium]|nr:cation transporter [Alphaproteobacteria bacterium]
MTEGGSLKVIFAALIGNALISVTKFAAAGMTGSSAMLSEAIHSLVDTGNQVLMLHGLRRAKKPADDAHPFGYGMEVYFWTFVVAILVFAGGAGVSIYEGVHKVLAPEPVSNVMINYAVLGAAMVFEGIAWVMAYREFGRSKGRMGLIEAVSRSKDPTVFTILFEDTAALLGLLVAFIGIAAADYLDMPLLDGVASIVIGLILALTASLLAFETKGLLIGEAAHPRVVEGMRRIARAEDTVIGVNEILTMHLGPKDILLNVSLDFADKKTAEDVETSVTNMERQIKMQFPEVTRVFIEAQSRASQRRLRS